MIRLSKIIKTMKTFRCNDCAYKCKVYVLRDTPPNTCVIDGQECNWFVEDDKEKEKDART